MPTEVIAVETIHTIFALHYNYKIICPYPLCPVLSSYYTLCYLNLQEKSSSTSREHLNKIKIKINAENSLVSYFFNLKYNN